MRADKKIGSPSNKEGNEGEVSLRREYGGKTSIFGKINGLWRKVGIDILGSPPDGSFPLFKSNTKLYTNGKLSFKNGAVDFRSKLKVSGSITANNSNFRIADDAEDDDWSIGSDSSDSYKFKIDKHSDVGGNTKFAIDKYGRVGIGESNPLSPLHVKDSNNSRTITDNLTTGFRNGIVINNSSEVRGTYSNLDFKAGKAYGRIAFDYNSPNYGDFHFITESGRAAYTRMSIKSNGMVGIGTTSPSSTLDVDGTISFGSLSDKGEGIKVTKFVDEADGIGSNDNDGSIPTSAAVKDYADNIVTTGALDSGSITSGFGNINIGSSTIDTTGNVSVGDLQVNGNDIAFDGSNSTISVDATAHDTAGARLILAAGDTTAGTTNNIEGGDLTLEGGQGKGSGEGGSILFRVADGGSSGSTLNSLDTALTIEDDKAIVCNGGPLSIKADSGETADLFLIADNEEDNGDIWKIIAADGVANNILTIANNISGSQVGHFTLFPHATVASSNGAFAGSLAVNGTSGITAGAVVWQSFPFILISSVNGRYYFIDVDDTANSYRRWDAYDTDPTGFNYRSVGGQFVVPENCTLIAMHGVIANNSSTNNPTVSIYHGTVTEGTGDTTLALAAGSGGAALTVTTGTLRVPFKFNDTFNVDLSAGDIVVPTISHADSGGTRSFAGSLTLKFITR